MIVGFRSRWIYTCKSRSFKPLRASRAAVIFCRRASEHTTTREIRAQVSHHFRIVLVAAVLAVVTALVFARGLHGGFVYDDYWLVESNPALRNPGPLWRFAFSSLFEGSRQPEEVVWAAGSTQYWRPFTKLLLLAQFRAFGTNAFGYHAVSLLVHVASVLLAFVWLRRRFARDRAAASPRTWIAAALAAALFGLHPARVESVSWISGLMDLWLVFWVLIALVLWDRRTRGATLGSAVALALAGMCKETALVVPFALALDVWAGGDRSDRRRLLAPFAAAAAVVVPRFVTLPPTAGLGVFGGFPRLLTSVGLYVLRVLWPLHPSTQIGIVGPSGAFEFSLPVIVLGAATLVALVAFALLALRRTTLRPWLADTAWFALPLLPVINLIAIGYMTLVAERFLALPLLGVAALGGRALLRLMARAPQRVPVLAIAGAAPCLAFAAISASYAPHLHSNETLWIYEIGLRPDNPNLHLYLSRVQASDGRPDEAMHTALQAYDRARTPDTRAWAAVQWASQRLRTLGDAEQPALNELRNFYDTLMQPGAVPTGGVALDAGATILRVDPSRLMRDLLRQSDSARMTRALAHARTGSYAIAESEFRALLRNESNPALAGNLVRVVAFQERLDEARALLQSARRAFPDDEDLTHLAALLDAEKNVSTEPDPARREAARVRLWLDLGSFPLARTTLDPLLANYPEVPEVVVASIFMIAEEGRIEVARRELFAARERDPAHAAIWDEAIAEFERRAGPAAPLSADLDALLR